MILISFSKVYLMYDKGVSVVKKTFIKKINLDDNGLSLWGCFFVEKLKINTL